MAAAWVLRIASGSITPDEREQLKRWLAEHPSHRAHLDHARRVWQGITALEETARRERRVAAFFRALGPRRRRVGYLAAAATAAACLAWVAVAPGFASHELSSPTGKVTRSVLADGSTLWLDSDAAAAFNLGRADRTLRVVRGRVHISIARDSRRPFRVLAQDAVIHDIGTAFTVGVEGPLRVAVEAGVVEVERSRSKWRLDAGTAAVFAPGEAVQAAQFDEQAGAWRVGRITLNQVPLEEALREADRYRPGRIVLMGSGTAHRKVSGSLSIDALDDSLQALAVGQRLRLVHLPYLLLVIPDER